MNFQLQSCLKQLDDVLESLETAVEGVNKQLHQLNEEKAAKQTEVWSHQQRISTLEIAQGEYDVLLKENKHLQDTLSQLREPVVHILQAAKSLGTELET